VTKVLLSITSHTIMYQDHGHCETFSSKLFIHNHSFTQKDQNDLTQSFGKLHPSFALWQLTLMTPLFGAHSRPRCPVLSVKTKCKMTFRVLQTKRSTPSSFLS
jgi:hypothetical protein